MLSLNFRKKSTEQQELERIEVLQKELAEHRRKNEASYRAALAGSESLARLFSVLNDESNAALFFKMWFFFLFFFLLAVPIVLKVSFLRSIHCPPPFPKNSISTRIAGWRTTRMEALLSTTLTRRWISLLSSASTHLPLWVQSLG